MNLASPIRFTISDGTNTATINFSSGPHSAGEVLNTINGQLLSSGLSSSLFAFFNSQNQLQLRASSTTAQARLQILDQSQGTSDLLNSIGWQSGVFLGPDLNDSAGIAQRSKRYIDSITGVGGVVLERIKTNGTFDREIQVYTDAISRAQDNLTAYETRLRNKFARLETQLAQLQTQSQALSAQLAKQQAQTSSS
jgi:flagellar capping protein FliD